jgi:hypothetical protein
VREVDRCETRGSEEVCRQRKSFFTKTQLLSAICCHERRLSQAARFPVFLEEKSEIEI